MQPLGTESSISFVYIFALRNASLLPNQTHHQNPLGGSVEKFYLSIYCHASLLQFLAFDSFLLWRICRSHGETTESKEKHWQIKNAAAPRSLQSRINSRVRGGNFYRQLGLSIIIMLSNKITVMSALLALRSLSLPCLNSIIQYHVLLHPSCQAQSDNYASLSLESHSQFFYYGLAIKISTLH